MHKYAVKRYEACVGYWRVGYIAEVDTLDDAVRAVYNSTEWLSKDYGEELNKPRSTHSRNPALRSFNYRRRTLRGEIIGEIDIIERRPVGANARS